MVSKLFSLGVITILLASPRSFADDKARFAALHHAPPATAAPHASLRIAASIDDPQTIKRALVVYFVGPDKAPKEVPFLRAADGYVAEIPEADVAPPNLGYTIELETADGKRYAAYATREAPHVVDVPEDLDDQRETALDKRLRGRRSLVSTTGEYVSFGTSSSANGLIRDNYYRLEGSYTYRPLRTVLEFGIRVGAVRGRAPVATKPGEIPPDPGLNYGAPFVTFRLHDLVHFETSLLTSVTERGFSSGIGGALHLGDPYGTKLVLGFETVKTFGTRGYSRLDLVRGWVRVSPMIEVTDAPHADRAGVRLLTELAFEHLPSGWSAAIRGGYAARDFNSGGAGIGASFGYEF